MLAIIGLGNPGEEYDGTRHNAGFLTIDNLAETFCADYWKDECGAKVAHIKNSSIEAENPECDELLLVKPQAFMNLSGGPVKKLMAKFELSPKNLIVVHDDMDIEQGKIRVKRGGSAAGHNGIKSIDSKIGSREYVRVRVGVGHAPSRMPTVDYVLQRPRGSSLEDFNKSIEKAAEAAQFLLSHSLEDTQQNFN